MPPKRTYFIMTPQLVWAACENAHQFVLWSAIKMVAGEEGVCVLGTRDLAALSMLGVGTVHQARRDLLRLGLIEGELCRDPGYPNEVWHLWVPDLWAANHAWREAHPALRERIEAKRAQRRGAGPGPGRGWARSGLESRPSGPEPARSGPEGLGSGPEGFGSGRETKEIPLLEPREKQGASLDTAWQNALVELAMQFPGSVYDAWIRPLRPAGWEGGRAVLRCPNRYVQEWCRERLSPAIQRVLGGILERPDLEIDYCLAGDGPPEADGRPVAR